MLRAEGFFLFFTCHPLLGIARRWWIHFTFCVRTDIFKAVHLFLFLLLLHVCFVFMFWSFVVAFDIFLFDFTDIFFFFPHWCRLDMHMLEMSNTMCRLPFAFIWTVYVQWCFVHPRLIKDRPQVADNLTCGEQLSKYSALKCQADVGSVCFDCSGNSLFRQRLHLSWLEIWRGTLTCVSTQSRHSELTLVLLPEPQKQ